MEEKFLHCVIPTLGTRIAGLEKAIDSIIKTTKTDNYEIIIALDADPNLHSSKPIVEFMDNKLKNNPNIRMHFTHRSKENTHGGAAALFGEVVETIKDEEDYILFIADDIEMIEPGWDVMSAKVFEAVFPDKIGTVCYDDGINHGRLNGHPYSNKKTFNHYGTLRAGYWHYFFDNDFTTFPQIDNNLIYVPQIALYNKHWILGLSPKDSTYVNAENKFWKHDEEVWHRRLYEAGFVIKDKQIVRIR